MFRAVGVIRGCCYAFAVEVYLWFMALGLKLSTRRCQRPAFGSGAFATGLAAAPRLYSAGLRTSGLDSMLYVSNT